MGNSRSVCNMDKDMKGWGLNQGEFFKIEGFKVILAMMICLGSSWSVLWCEDRCEGSGEWRFGYKDKAGRQDILLFCRRQDLRTRSGCLSTSIWSKEDLTRILGCFLGLLYRLISLWGGSQESGQDLCLITLVGVTLLTGSGVGLGGARTGVGILDRAR